MSPGAAIVIGFFVLMLGLGVVLDSSWNATGALLGTAGAALSLWGARTRR